MSVTKEFVCLLNFLAIISGHRRFHSYNGRFGSSPSDTWNNDAPSRLFQPIPATYRLIQSGAPPQPYNRSREALQLPLLADGEPLANEIYIDIKEGLQYVFQTKSAWAFAAQGSATTAIQAVLDNLIEPGDRVLVGICGHWGDLMADIARRLDANVITIRKRTGRRFSFQEISSAVKRYKPKVLALVQGESTAGVFQPLDGIGDLCQREGCLFVSDSTSVVGMQAVMMDKLKIDAAMTGSQKGLGGIVGLAPIVLSDRAVERIKNRTKPPRGYQTDLIQIAQQWNATGDFQSYSVPLLYSLRESLALMAEEGMENTFERHAKATRQLHQGMEALGLRHFVDEPNDRLVGITTFHIPSGKDATKISDYMLNRHNIFISTGYGEIAGKVLRFATYAINADPTRVENLVMALKDALNSSETNIS
ncbi:Serine--pyruvate aminotransferase, mitochondrial [Orchesella cincta]|uniref:Alanine--glyoxylate aminotransferase n=1 Tax=Orchesella cincta TaxID=48709 RepID=A0A1D2NLS4_ORCCI|nr:Serine--pyruvate aminotransferase, mitochondrial [Orchesella cincta]